MDNSCILFSVHVNKYTNLCGEERLDKQWKTLKAENTTGVNFQSARHKVKLWKIIRIAFLLRLRKKKVNK